MKSNQTLNVKMFQIYILYERQWILFEKHDDLIYNEHGVVEQFAEKTFKTLNFTNHKLIEIHLKFNK
jgi:hypothetical protein